MVIALDAMGGDHAPHDIVVGAVEAVKSYSQLKVLLVGPQEIVAKELKKTGYQGNQIDIKHANSVVGMAESPALALRKKKDSSLRIANSLVKSGDADAVISAGNTGAAMVFSKIVLGTLTGIERPAIAAVLPSKSGVTLLLDVGANVDCSAKQLSQFAVMGYVYAQDILGITSPRLGMLNIGSEEAKGSESAKEALQALKKLGFERFLGNVEGRDIYNGNADVVVCDGFTGNVGLKISEGLSGMITGLLKEEISKSFFGKLGFLLLKPAFREIKRKVDYAEYGGAPLLGVKGVSIICHGSSSPKAIKNALRVAQECVAQKTNLHMLERLNQRSELS